MENEIVTNEETIETSTEVEAVEVATTEVDKSETVSTAEKPKRPVTLGKSIASAVFARGAVAMAVLSVILAVFFLMLAVACTSSSEEYCDYSYNYNYDDPYQYDNMWFETEDGEPIIVDELILIEATPTVEYYLLRFACVIFVLCSLTSAVTFIGVAIALTVLAIVWGAKSVSAYAKARKSDDKPSIPMLVLGIVALYTVVTTTLPIILYAVFYNSSILLALGMSILTLLA